MLHTTPMKRTMLVGRTSQCNTQLKHGNLENKQSKTDYFLT